METSANGSVGPSTGAASNERFLSRVSCRTDLLILQESESCWSPVLGLTETACLCSWGISLDSEYALSWDCWYWYVQSGQATLMPVLTSAAFLIQISTVPHCNPLSAATSQITTYCNYWHIIHLKFLFTCDSDMFAFSVLTVTLADPLLRWMQETFYSNHGFACSYADLCCFVAYIDLYVN